MKKLTMGKSREGSSSSKLQTGPSSWEAIRRNGPARVFLWYKLAKMGNVYGLAMLLLADLAQVVMESEARMPTSASGKQAIFFSLVIRRLTTNGKSKTPCS